MCTVSIVMIGKEKKFTRVGNEANDYGALWTMPLVLPLVFFFSYSFYYVAFFFCSGLSSLSLSTGFDPLFFLLLHLCLFACVSFLICCSKGESRGGWYTLRQSRCSCVGWPVLSSLCFCFSFAYSSIFLPWSFFSVPLFSYVCLSSLSLSVCIVHSLYSVCPLCVCPLFLFLFVLCLSLGSFLFSFPLFSFFVHASIMACIGGARRMLPRSAVVSAESGWRRWTVCFETTLFWAEAVILQFGHWNYDILQSDPYSWKILSFF